MSLYSMMAESIYKKCSDAVELLKNTPGWQVALVPAALSAMGFMTGAAMDSYHSIDVMHEGAGFFANVTPEGAAAYKELAAEKLAAVQDSWYGIVKQGLEWGFVTDGQNVAAVSAGAMPALPCLALIAKAAAHARDLFRGKDDPEKAAAQVEADYDAAPGR